MSIEHQGFRRPHLALSGTALAIGPALPLVPITAHFDAHHGWGGYLTAGFEFSVTLHPDRT